MPDHDALLAVSEAQGWAQREDPPWMHSFQHPLPELVMVETEDGPVEVERWPLLPSYTITRAPEYTGVLSYLEQHRD